MSLTTHRQLIAAAVDTLDDVTGYQRFVADLTPGVTYPRLERIDVQAFGSVVFWNVVTVLPQDPATAEAWIEDHTRALRDALTGVVKVTAVVPQRLDTDAGVLPALFTNGWREDN